MKIIDYQVMLYAKKYIHSYGYSHSDLILELMHKFLISQKEAQQLVADL